MSFKGLLSRYLIRIRAHTNAIMIYDGIYCGLSLNIGPGCKLSHGHFLHFVVLSGRSFVTLDIFGGCMAVNLAFDLGRRGVGDRYGGILAQGERKDSLDIHVLF